MSDFSYWFFWTQCVLQLAGVLMIAAKIGKDRPPYSAVDLFTSLLIFILMFFACIFMKLSAGSIYAT